MPDNQSYIGKLAEVTLVTYLGKRKKHSGRINWQSTGLAGFQRTEYVPLVRLEGGNSLHRADRVKIIE